MSIEIAGRQVFSGVSAGQPKPALERMLAGCLQHWTSGETFLAFTRAHDLNSLQQTFTDGRQPFDLTQNALTIAGFRDSHIAKSGFARIGINEEKNEPELQHPCPRRLCRDL